MQEKKHNTLAQVAVAISVDLDLPRLIAGENNSHLKAELERTYVGVYYMTSWFAYSGNPTLATISNYFQHFNGCPKTIWCEVR